MRLVTLGVLFTEAIFIVYFFYSSNFCAISIFHCYMGLKFHLLGSNEIKNVSQRKWFSNWNSRFWEQTWDKFLLKMTKAPVEQNYISDFNYFVWFFFLHHATIEPLSYRGESSQIITFYSTAMTALLEFFSNSAGSWRHL